VGSKPNWAKQVGLTPGKMALMAVLAVVFLGVLYVQLRGTSAKSPAVVAPPTAAPKSSAGQSKANESHDARAAAHATARKKTVVHGNWQPPAITTVVEYDPFARPASFPQPFAAEAAGALAQNEAQSREDASTQRAAIAAEREQMQSQLAGLRQQGVRVIIKRNDQYVAIVGEKEVHVGDQIDGFTVIAIDADGVRVAKDLSP